MFVKRFSGHDVGFDSKTEMQGNLFHFDFGSGCHRLKGFVGVDIRKDADAHILISNDYWDKFPDNCAKTIHSCHFIEHLSYEDAFRIFELWYRMLVEGGKLQIFFPDLSKVDYQQNPESALWFAWGTHVYKYDFHLSFWNSWLMKKYLKDYGFKNIKEVKYPADYHYWGDHDDNWTAGIECEK